MNLIPAEDFVSKSKGAPFSHEDVVQLITKAQANALRRAAALADHGTVSMVLLQEANRLDPDPKAQ